MSETNENINENLDDKEIEDIQANEVDVDAKKEDKSVEDMQKEIERLKNENKAHVLKGRKSKLEKLGYTDLELLNLESLNDEQFNSFIKFMNLNKKENENIEQYVPTVSSGGGITLNKQIKKESFLD